MDIWNWTREWSRKALESGDNDRIELYRRFHDGMDLMRLNPARAADVLGSNAEAARNLNESWWALLNEHWRLQALHQFQGDAGKALDIAVRIAVEARKHPQLPQRVCIHEDLIGAYIDIDAQGHAERIQAALDYMEQEVAPTSECRFCLLGLRRNFALEMGDYPLVAHLGFQELGELQGWSGRREHHAAQVLADLCRVALAIHRSNPDDALGERDEMAVRREQAENLLAWAQAGEDMARSVDHDGLIPALIMWQAVAIRILCEESNQVPEDVDDNHAGLYKQAQAAASALRIKPSDGYYAAWRSYHEPFGEWENVLEATDAMLASVQGCGRKSREARGLTYRCFVLANLDRLERSHLETARASARKLAEPAELIESLRMFDEWLDSRSDK